MKQYWIRILGAYLLMKFASGLVKDAERLLKENSETPTLTTTDSNLIEGAVIDG